MAKKGERVREPVNITKRTVDAAKPTDREYVLWDRELKGFGLKVMPSGTKTYLVKYRVGGGRNGQARKRTIGRHGKFTPTQARKVAEGWLLKVANGEDPAGEKDKLREAPTFKDIVDLYVEEYLKVETRSWREGERILNKYCKAWHGTKAHAIDSAAVARLLVTVKAVNGPIMANRVHTRIRSMYAWAVGNHLLPDITTNPARDVARPVKKEKPDDRVYSDEEIKALWKAFGAVGVQGAAYKLILTTGQRLNEVMRMEWSEIENHLWTLPAERSKNGRTHLVPLSGLALKILEAQKGRHERFVFASPTGRDIPVSPTNVISKLVRAKSGVADFKSHDLRRTMATQSTKLGFSRFHVERMLNHTEPGVGGVYDRYDYFKEKTEIANRWAIELRHLTEGGNVVPIKAVA